MARIVFTLEDGTEIETELDADLVTIGRAPDNTVVLPSPSISSNHAVIKRRGESLYVQDLGATNGTKLNGVDIEEAKLEDGDQITFGDVPGMVHFLEGRKKPAPRVQLAPPDIATDTKPVKPQAAPVPPGGHERHPLKKRGVRTPYSPKPQSDNSGCATFFVFLFVLLMAVFGGLFVRHYNDHNGANLIMDLLKIWEDKKQAAPAKSPDPNGAAPENTVPTPAAPAPTADPAATPAPAPAPTTPAPAPDAAAPAPAAPAPAPAPATAPGPAMDAAPAMDMNMN